MAICILGGKEGFLRKTLSTKLASLGQTVAIGATAAQFSTAIQNIYNNRYTEGQDSLKVSRKLTLTSSQTGTNVDIADNWYTTCDASAVYAAGVASVKVARKLTLTASQTGTDVNITDNWYTTCDASAVYNKGKTDATIANVDAQKITVYCHCEGHTSTTGANVVRPNATLTVTLPTGASGTHTVSGSVNTDGTGSKNETNITVNSWLTITTMTAYDVFRGNSRMEATFRVTYNGSTSTVKATLAATNVHQSGSADWYSDASSTRYIVTNGTTVYQKLAVSSSTAQMV